MKTLRNILKEMEFFKTATNFVVVTKEGEFELKGGKFFETTTEEHESFSVVECPITLDVIAHLVVDNNHNWKLEADAMERHFKQETQEIERSFAEHYEDHPEDDSRGMVPAYPTLRVPHWDIVK